MKRQREAERAVCNVGTLVTELKSCGKKRDLQWGKRIHEKAVESGYISHMHVLATLVQMYAKCGSMIDARSLFESIPKPDVVSWNVLILGYAENGEGLTAMDMFSRMKGSGCDPSSITYVAALKACASLAGNEDGTKNGECLGWGREIHKTVGYHMNNYVQNSLIDMYAKCGSMVDARRVFDSMQKPDMVSWNSLILGYAENGEAHVALRLFSRMKASGYAPDSVTYVAAIKACTASALLSDDGRKTEFLDLGRRLHQDIGSHMDKYVQNTLIDMYSKCNSMVEARCVFDSLQNPDVVSWTALMLGYAENGEGHIALDLFSRMKTRGYVPNSVTYVAALKACLSLAVNADNSGKIACLDLVRKLHTEIGYHSVNYVQNTLVDLYAKCGSMAEARRVFECMKGPTVVSWTALLQGYADNGEGHFALELFSRMKSRGLVPTSVTYVAALKACTSLAVSGRKEECLQRGRQIHSEIGSGQMNPYVESTLIDMYAKCGDMVEARRTFDSILEPVLVSWNALILGYAENGEGHLSLELYSKMKKRGCVPNFVTHLAALKACSLTGALLLGRKMHSEITEFTSNVVTCLVDFYAKCGSIVEAHDVFSLHSKVRGVSTWNALLAGYGSFGDIDTMLKLFDAMQDEGVQPDSVTFVCILLSCSHAGLLEKATEYFEAMPLQYRVKPTLTHYTCMVDVLGRANQLNEAVAVLRTMPYTPDAVTWRSLLGACHKWKNVEIGRLAFQYLVSMNKDDSPAHVLMGHIYGSRGMWEEQERVLQGVKLKTGALEQAYVVDDSGKMLHLGDEDGIALAF